ncbi:sel1 repeat family protein [bacterium]|jgi:outer membrane lipopolysaccharide assembly protein LptE/RlpB|nr:sel1 repeat family protein [bacterium]
MFKLVTSSFITATLSIFLLSACADHSEALKVLPNELAIADGCKNPNKKFEMDCYDLISYKNTFAQLRLGLNAQLNGNYEEAFQRYLVAKQRGNFYVNSLLAELYNNGLGVQRSEETVIKLLDEVKDVDPIAAYKLSFHYLAKEDNKKALKLLNYAAENNVKEAQYELSRMYSNADITDTDLEKSVYWNELYEDKSSNFIKKIYGN